jgi:O-antigen/teichoic acid export membrane protein
VTSVVINLLVNVFMARLLGAQGFGVFAVVLAWSLVLSVPAGLGFDRLLVRELARWRPSADPAPLRSLLRTALAAGGGASLAAAALVLGAAVIFGDGDPTGSFGAIAMGALIVPLLTLTNLWEAAIQGLHRVARGLLPESVVRPGALLVLTLAVLGVSSGRPPAVAGTLLLALAAAVGLAAAVWSWLRLAPAVLKAQTRDVATRSQASRARTRTDPRWLRAALPLTFLATASIVSSQADVVLVGMLLDERSAGIYAIAVRTSLLVSFPLSVMNSALTPTYAALMATGDRDRLQHIVTWSVRAVSVLTLVAAAAFLLFGDRILSLFGPDFRAGAPALAILVVGQLSNAVMGPTGALMIMSGNERRAAAIVTIGAIAEIVLVVLLAPRFGLEGAAVGGSAGLIAWNLLMLRDVRRRLGIRPSLFGT